MSAPDKTEAYAIKKFDPTDIPAEKASGERRVRFAPSPTGALHIGGARTALFNWLVARGSGGQFVLRIEDTDAERSTDENISQILDALDWLGLDWDEGPYLQADPTRAESHRAAIEKLVAKGLAYHDQSGKAEVDAWKEKHGRDRGYRGDTDADGEGAIRLRVPDMGSTVVRDLVKGDIVFENRSMDDFVIARGDGSPLYNFAVAVDDAEMRITDVVRGDDHISNTPKQQLVLEALGYPAPAYAHVPLLHNTDGKKTSKRDNAASVQALRDDGYLPEAVCNYIAFLGWGADDDESILGYKELVSQFDIGEVRSSPARMDEKKLRWVNGRYLRDLSPEDYLEAVVAYTGLPEDDVLREACLIAQEKTSTLADFYPLVRFLYEKPEYVIEEKAWRKTMKNDAERVLVESRRRLSELDDFSASSIEAVIAPLAEEYEVAAGKIYQPIRVAISGGTVTPGIFGSVSLLGREETLVRIDAALEVLRDSSSEAPKI